jgi:hypothetical protein
LSDELFKIKEMFFDRKGVMHAVDDATRRSLSRAGAFVRTSARSSMRRVKANAKPSAPGSPPRARLGFIKDFLFFSYDASHKSVIVGPARLNGRGGEAPHVQEFGGTASITVRQGFGKRRRRVRVNAHYPARPYMWPALQKNLNVIPEQFRDSIRRSS